MSLLALLSAAAYGAADFLGGVAARRAAAVAVVITSQAAGLILLLALFPLLPSATVTRGDLLWGAAAGLAGGVGVALLYRALAIGPMSIVAPLTAVCAAAVPVAVGLMWLGERVSITTASGMGLAVVAIILVGQEAGRSPPSAPRSHPVSPEGIRLAIAAGVAVGLFLALLEPTAAAAGLWPLVPARLASIGVFTAIALGTRRAPWVPRRVAGPAVGCGALDMFANALYLVAIHHGRLSVVATLVSLYPASTVVMARIVFGERWSPLQATGVALAVAATLLIVGGAR